MKIRKIKLVNFRQFYGSHELVISDHPDKNVTLIHAQNGVGKTTILNSVLWTFYNYTTAKFLEPDKIVNRAAFSEGVKKASVGIEFTHEGNEYLAQRFFQQDRREHVFKVHRVIEGDYKELTVPDEFIQSVMPQAMARYFFFDGEHAETFSAAHHHKEVGRAIRNILGCNIAEFAIEDLNYCSKRLVKEISEIPDADDLKESERTLSKLELNSQQLDEKIRIFEETRTTYQETVDELGSQLQTLTVVAAKQKLREEKERSLRGTRAEILECQRGIVGWAGRSDTLRLVGTHLSESSLDFIDEETIRGKIPEPYNELFVKGLLQANLCICGRPLADHSHEYHAVFKLLEKAGSSVVLNRVVKARSKCEELRKDPQSAVRELRKTQDKLGALRQREQELEQEIAAVTKEIANINIAEVQEKEEARRRALNEIRTITEQIGAMNHQKRRLDAELLEAKRSYAKLSGDNVRAKPLRLRLNLAEAASEFLKVELKGHEKSARKLIQDDVAQIIKTTARKDYRYRLYDDYRMELLYADGTMVPRSTGESQLLSLAFIAALVRYAKKRSTATGKILIPGIVAPLVLDSPFGQLDDVYREATARFVPELAEQVVVLVSRSQGDEAVLNALRTRVGEEYVLTAENQGERGERKEEHIAINGRSYPLTRYECEREMTRIQRVN